MKVLIADDSRSMREMLKGALVEVGYEVVATEDGRQAWEALRKGDLQLAVLDWVMPGMDGVEVCRKIQSERAYHPIHVILLTSKEGTENVVTALTAGASDYICKPFHPEELIARLKVGERNVDLQMQMCHMQKMEAIGRLAAGIAHEINTPLQYITDNTYFLKDTFREIVEVFEKHMQVCGNGEKNETGITRGYTDLHEHIGESSKAIKDTLEGLGVVAKMVTAMKEFSTPGEYKQKTVIDINRAIENTIIVARNEWKNVAEVKTCFDADQFTVSCFPSDINLVMLSIITNAAYAIADGMNVKKGQKGIISISTRRCGDYAEIKIGDTGKGIPVKIRPKIFDPFFTTKEVGKGTGLGLAISRSIVVEKHGGTISFDTETGRGTTFIIRLPIGADTFVKDE